MLKNFKKMFGRLSSVQETEEEKKQRERDVQELDALLLYWEEHPEILDHLDRVMGEERTKAGPNEIIF